MDNETLFIPLADDTGAVVVIHLKTRRPGAMDPPQRRAPTAGELHQIAEALVRRIYQFTPDPTI